MNGDDMNNTDMNLSITEMMELILTGANGSELAVEGVVLNAIDHIKKLEEQNEKMLSILKKVNGYVLSAEETFSIYREYICVNFLDKFEPETISDIRSILQKVEGEKK